MPPARCTSEISHSPDGDALQMHGTVWLMRSMSSSVKSTSALCAIARMCSTVFVEPPIATSIVIAFSNACLVAIERGSTDSSSCW